MFGSSLVTFIAGLTSGMIMPADSMVGSAGCSAPKSCVTIMLVSSMRGLAAGGFAIADWSIVMPAASSVGVAFGEDGDSEASSALSAARSMIFLRFA